MKKKTGMFWLIGGGVAAAGAAWLALRQSSSTVEDIKKGIEKTPTAGGLMPTFAARTTGYWPFTAAESEKKMEGGIFDRAMPDKYKNQPDSQQYKDHLLHTLEDFQAGRAPFVSVSGDPDIFPYGQRLALDAWPGVVFRVVDTGGHFHGAGKIYRIAGYEPLDICVQSSKTKVPTTTTATIYPGDHFAKKGLQEVAYGKFKDQTVAGDEDENA